MGTFDIQYSKYLPTAQPGLAKANLDIDMGQAEFYQSISNFGTAILSYGTALQETKNAADFSSLQRQDAEDFSATQRAAKEIGFNDPEEEDDNGNIR